MLGLTKDEIVKEASKVLNNSNSWLNDEIQEQLKSGKNDIDSVIQALVNYNQVVIPTLIAELIDKNNEAISKQLSKE